MSLPKALPNTPHLVVIRKGTFLAEVWSAETLKRVMGAQILETPHVTEPTKELLAAIQALPHGRVIIFGGFYRDSFEQISHAAMFSGSTVVTVVSSESDLGPPLTFRGTPCQWTLNYIKEVEKTSLSLAQTCVAQCLDNYLCGYPSIDEIQLYNGLSALKGSNIGEQIMGAETLAQIAEAQRVGAERWARDLEIINRVRIPSSKEFLLQGAKEGQVLSVLLAEADTTVVTTSWALAIHASSGVGVTMRHSFRENTTSITICAHEASGCEAAELAKKWFNGGGSPFLGGGKLDGLRWPTEVFGKFILTKA